MLQQVWYLTVWLPVLERLVRVYASNHLELLTCASVIKK